eukprot:6791438-Ditylum_brightwellii.AAC.1
MGDDRLVAIALSLNWYKTYAEDKAAVGKDTQPRSKNPLVVEFRTAQPQKKMEMNNIPPMKE